MNYDRRLYEDKESYPDWATWLDAHGLTEDRRKANIINQNNHDSNCLVFQAGICCCDLNQEVIARIAEQIFPKEKA